MSYKIPCQRTKIKVPYYPFVLRKHIIEPSFFQIMIDCAKNPLVIPICTVPGRLADFQNLGAGLENCQKSLNEYLESKRRLFPRFYFISTDELLSILGNSEPSGVQDHMIKVLIYMSTIFLPFSFCYISFIQLLFFLYGFRSRLSIVSMDLVSVWVCVRWWMAVFLVLLYRCLIISSLYVSRRTQTIQT